MTEQSANALELARHQKAPDREAPTGGRRFVVEDTHALHQALEVVPVPALILDAHRIIHWANQAMQDYLAGLGNGKEISGEVTGKYLGEVVGCEHALTRGSTCGETPFCPFCGANQAIRQGLAGQETALECQIARQVDTDPPALDLKVWATPLWLQGKPATLIFLQDISAEKRRQALERTFFHDILNSATIVSNAIQLIQDSLPDLASSGRNLLELATTATTRLIDEILAQRDLTLLEGGDLIPHATVVRSRRLLETLLDSYASSELGQGRNLTIDPEAMDIEFQIDATMLQRVLGNLIKNALEASNVGETVSAGCTLTGEATIEFWVHNESVMPESVQRQVFKRSFSTKGPGRGLGTYSLRLLTERYLEGKVSFSSSPGQGTTFYVRYPLIPSYAGAEDDSL